MLRGVYTERSEYCMDYPHRQWVSASTSYGKRAVKGRVHHCLVATRCPDRHHPTMWVIHTHSLRSVSTPRSISCATRDRPFAALRVTPKGTASENLGEVEERCSLPLPCLCESVM